MKLSKGTRVHRIYKALEAMGEELSISELSTLTNIPIMKVSASATDLTKQGILLRRKTPGIQKNRWGGTHQTQLFKYRINPDYNWDDYGKKKRKTNKKNTPRRKHFSPRKKTGDLFYIHVDSTGSPMDTFPSNQLKERLMEPDKFQMDFEEGDEIWLVEKIKVYPVNVKVTKHYSIEGLE